MEADLIYDVGLHDGGDTAYYLSEGYRVVAVEADLRLVHRAHRRFERDIRARRLTVLPVAVSSHAGVGTFWLSGVSQWNSFDRTVASRLGAKHSRIDVVCRRFRDILEEHGVPYYLKVDIEKSDRLCVAGIDPADAPRYVSVEFNGLDDLVALRDLGYDKFKVIDQATTGHPQLGGGPARSGRTTARGALGAASLRVDGDTRRRTAWPVMPPGPSGPFGEATDGRWETFAQTASRLRGLVEDDSGVRSPFDWFTWFDLHATRGDRVPASGTTPGGFRCN